METLITMPPEITPAVGWLIIGLSFFTSLITAAFSIGGGFIMLAVLAQVLAPVALIPVHGAVQLGSSAGRAAMMLKHVNWPVFAPFTVGCLIGSSVGGLTFVQIPAWFIQLGIGIFLIWTVVGHAPRIDGKKVFATGIISSFLIIFFGSTANFIAAIVKAMNLSPPGHVSTHATLMAIQHVLKLIIFGILGFTFEPYLPLLIMMILSGLAGTFVGKLLLMRAGGHYFKPVLNVILVLLAARLIWMGVSGLLDAI